ncbi:hypothetical protein COB11_04340 [Candidatus Aerophobetes bacterium]|uniref:Uncharacterized protein n=1 Tax=Aerophobetes bacterium TaxID=2030807 RepID=A0A2A4YHG5_UNCAE|nr:MAG: hypothetical protein COB11_04340 [Candidatus Aerophobetes bacterium]
MTAEHIEIFQQKSNQIIKAAGYFQGIAIVIAASTLYFKPLGYKEIGQCFSMLALFSSFVITKWYIYNGKKIETMKTFSGEGRNSIKNEYLFSFFAPYILWVACIGVFS